MKNNFFLFLIIFILNASISASKEFKFETSDIQILENGNLIFANDGKAISFDKDLEIEASNFEYSKKLNFLKANNNGIAFIKSQDLKIIFDEMVVDQESSIMRASGNVEIYEIKKNLIIKTTSVTYNKKNGVLNSEVKSTVTDKYENIFYQLFGKKGSLCK